MIKKSREFPNLTNAVAFFFSFCFFFVDLSLIMGIETKISR